MKKNEAQTLCMVLLCFINKKITNIKPCKVIVSNYNYCLHDIDLTVIY